jgi:hypothetical protein
MMTQNEEEVGHDLAYAASHLNLLSLCSYNSSTARSLYSTLQIIFSEIREIIVSPTFRNMRSSLKDVQKTPQNQPRQQSDFGAGFEDTNMRIRDVVERILTVLQQRLSF